MKSTSEVIAIPSSGLRHVLRVARVQDWIYLLGIAGIALVRNVDRIDLSIALKVSTFSAVYLCWGYVFNNLFDLEEDSSSRKNPFLLHEARTGRAVTAVLSLALLGWAAALELVPETLAMMALNAVYSVRPIRLKRWLAPALVANGFFFGFVYYAAAKTIHGFVPPDEFNVALFVFLVFLPLQYVHSVEHREIEGSSWRMEDRIALAGLLVALSAWSFSRPELESSFVATSTYSVAFFALALTERESASRLRLRLRWMSGLFGLALLASLGGVV